MLISDHYLVAQAESASDTTNFRYGTADALYIGGTGNVTVVLENDVAVLFAGAVVGTILPLRIKRVNSTNTAGSGYVALYRY